MKSVLQRFVEACDFPASFQVQALQQFASWDLRPLYIGTASFGAIALKDHEIHFAVYPGFRHRAIQRHRLEATMRDLLEEFGYLTTVVLRERTAQQRFVRRLGFTELFENSMWVTYIRHDGDRHESA